MNCPSCGQENPESAVRCGKCRAALHNFADDRTMDTPASSGGLTDSLPARIDSSTKAPSMVRTPSGHSSSQSRSSSGGSGQRSRILEPGDELGPRFLIDELLGEGGM